MFSIQQLKDTGLQAVRFCFWTTALLSYLKLTLTCLIRLLWSRSSYPRNCYHCVFTIGIGSLSLWRNFLLHVWQRLFHLLPFFSCQVCWSFWRSVKGCGRLVLNNTLPKILPYSSESPAVGFCVLPQMPDKWLLSGTEKHQWNSRGASWRYSLYQHHLHLLQWQRQGFSTALLTVTSPMHMLLLLKCL